MNTATDQNRKLERDFYEPVKNWLDKILAEKFASHHLEVTANGSFSNIIQKQIADHRDLIFAFLKKDAAPDLTGFVKKTDSLSREFLIVEMKNEPIKLDDIYQTRKYAELFDARYALLISTHEVPEKIIRLARVMFPYLLAIPAYKKVTLVHFGKDGADVSWFESDPFAEAVK